MSFKPTNFRQRLLNGEMILGTFQKTPSMMIAEVLASSELDVVCIDAEHAPFDRQHVDQSVFAYRSAAKPSLVRVPNDHADQILGALDCGATGVVVPHVTTANQAVAVAKAARYGELGRGYAGSTRAANYTGNSVKQNLDAGQNTTVIAQIEDLAALEELEAIANVRGIDCLFIGMMDLTIALGCQSADDPKVVNTAERICEMAGNANRRTGIFVSDTTDIAFWRERGVTLFLTASEHSFILQGVRKLVAAKGV